MGPTRGRGSSTCISLSETDEKIIEKVREQMEHLLVSLRALRLVGNTPTSPTSSFGLNNIFGWFSQTQASQTQVSQTQVSQASASQLESDQPPPRYEPPNASQRDSLKRRRRSWSPESEVLSGIRAHKFVYTSPFRARRSDLALRSIKLNNIELSSQIITALDLAAKSEDQYLRNFTNQLLNENIWLLDLPVGQNQEIKDLNRSFEIVPPDAVVEWLAKQIEAAQKTLIPKKNSDSTLPGQTALCLRSREILHAFLQTWRDENPPRVEGESHPYWKDLPENKYQKLFVMPGDATGPEARIQFSISR
ncbi:hypothetical protein M427DRAFT_305161 [Gonapodya prolifera JEL478]|uniref:Uncharacterized protein n=1 Tax=Gonapodya prolifera (strain JEL478) TaxID=1344416 RepID=A0A138ZWA0_GONPJ|nr:hypothetical protein M427DRAFT_305161 [Gonapodya prolifera JEL478]|eukprot:KXS08779.1 hypothetical protein M427DRAFT_305161 [Gonapodya prolifera JEL478]